jgi:hypothetical protein
MSTIAEALVSDGEKPRISSMRIFVRLYKAATADPNGLIALQPLVVQTNGTFTDTENQAVHTIAELLDAAIDDEFGFQKLGDLRVSKIKNTTDDGGNEGHEVLNFQIDIPGNIIGLLNKEVSTERLQNLSFGLAGKTAINAGTIGYNIWYRVIYIKQAKGITIR